MIVEMKKIGDWDKVAELTKRLAPDIHKSVMQGQKAAALRLETIVKDHLIDQDLGWKPLAASTKSHKKEGKDMILVERWRYYEAIKIEKRGNTYLIGVTKNKYYQRKGSRIQIYKVAAFHEGNPQITNLWGQGIKLPVRKLWTPSVKEWALDLDKRIVKSIRQHLEKRGWDKVTLKQLRDYKAPV